MYKNAPSVFKGVDLFPVMIIPKGMEPVADSKTWCSTHSSLHVYFEIHNSCFSGLNMLNEFQG